MRPKIRNFTFISHIDHGKSTLADRFLELTGSVDKRKMRPQYLDLMDLERERGITIKMQPVRMMYSFSGREYLLNLIDTPGHIDFAYEVSRSLAAVEGAVLLVDASKGIQAQTIGNLEMAQKQNLAVIPVINKIDLVQARVKETELELAKLLNVHPSEIIKISAKNGVGVEKVLEAVIKKIPAPIEKERGTLRALIFDSKYDPFKGVFAFVRVFEGEIQEKENIYLIQSGAKGESKEVGIFKPELKPVEKLSSGEIGFIATGIKESEKVRVGDTITDIQAASSPFPGYKEPQPKVFLSVFPQNSNDFEVLKVGLEKLKLTDAALHFKPELKEGLGRGFQCGFLGLLHAEILVERLKREFGISLVLSAPSVAYKVVMEDNKEFLVRTASDWPDASRISGAKELWASMRVLTPLNYFGAVLDLLKKIDSRHIKTEYVGLEKVELIYEVPLREILVKNFFDKLKSVSQGFASMDYEILDWRVASLVKLDILILGQKEEAFSRIVPEKDVYKEGKKMVEKLKENLPPQLFSVPLQAAVYGRILAREDVKARRRDVIAPLYGGDYTRKRKLLEKQKKGKEKLKGRGKVRIPPEVYLKIFGE